MSKELISTNPAKNYEPVGEVSVTSEQEIIDKVAAVNATKAEWRNTALQTRIDLVAKAYQVFLREIVSIKKPQSE